MGTQDRLDWKVIYLREARRACRAIRSRFPETLQPRFEVLDFVHEAFVTILANPARVDGKRVGHLIIHIALRRMLDQSRRPESRCKGCKPEAVLDAAPPCELLAEADELLSRLMGRARDGRKRLLIRLKAEGHSTPEAAVLAGRGLHTAERSLARILRRA
jgi:DNA-directed RNA polymerase specialized sigma24 family protein